MTPEKIVSVVKMYEQQFLKAGVPKTRMDPQRTFQSLSVPEVLAHAHYLCGSAKSCAGDPGKLGRANRHLASIQMCLSFVGWLTLEDIMQHNRPDEERDSRSPFHR